MPDKIYSGASCLLSEGICPVSERVEKYVGGFLPPDFLEKCKNTPMEDIQRGGVCPIYDILMGESEQIERDFGVVSSKISNVRDGLGSALEHIREQKADIPEYVMDRISTGIRRLGEAINYIDRRFEQFGTTDGD